MVPCQGKSRRSSEPGNHRMSYDWISAGNLGNADQVLSQMEDQVPRRDPLDVLREVPMPAIVEYPTVVQELLSQYGNLFANEPERRHFAEYLTGLFIAERKTVSGMNREFAVTTDQSCLNRFLTEVD